MVGCILPPWRSTSFPSARCTLLGERSPLETPAVAPGTDRARNIFNGRLPLWPQIRPLRVAIVERSSCSRRESRSSTPKKASPMSQDVARRAARRTRRAGTPRVAAAATRPPDPDPARTPAATIDQSARCTPPFARPAARILRCPSSRASTSRCTAPIASPRASGPAAVAVAEAAAAVAPLVEVAGAATIRHRPTTIAIVAADAAADTKTHQAPG
jgi:hypothetical protein